MKNLLIFGAVLLSAASAEAQVRMYVTLDGRRVGQAVASQKLLPEGGKLVQLNMTLASQAGNSVTLRSESTYDSKGAPTRMFHESSTTNPKVKRTVTVSFSKAGAHVVEESGGKRNVRDIPLVEGAPITSKSEFWFIRDTPNIGAVDKRYRFNVSKLEWELVTTTYKGLKTIKVGGKSVQAHELHSDLGTAWVDGKGLPHRLEIGPIKLERVPGP